jgi:hypothetical protein
MFSASLAASAKCPWPDPNVNVWGALATLQKDVGGKDVSPSLGDSRRDRIFRPGDRVAPMEKAFPERLGFAQALDLA